MHPWMNVDMMMGLPMGSGQPLGFFQNEGEMATHRRADVGVEVDLVIKHLCGLCSTTCLIRASLYSSPQDACSLQVMYAGQARGKGPAWNRICCLVSPSKPCDRTSAWRGCTRNKMLVGKCKEAFILVFCISFLLKYI